MSIRKVDNILSSVSFNDTTDESKKLKLDLTGIAPSTTRVLTVLDANTTLANIDSAQTLINKTIDSVTNTITNLDNTNIKNAAAIDATKIADGSVSNTNFQYLSGVTSTIVGTTDTQTLTNKSFSDSTTYIVDDLDNTKKLQFEVSGITTGTTRTLTVPDSDITLVGLNTAQTLTSKTLTLPIITSISNAGTVTLPTGTNILIGRTTTDSLSNKTLLADNCTYADSSDNTKKVQFILSGITTGQTRVLTVPDTNLTLAGTSNTQTLTNKNMNSDLTFFINNADTTKKIRFDSSAISTGQTRVLTAPDTNLTLAGIAIAQAWTNKTLTDATNTVGANELRTTGASVNIDSAAPPTTGQALTATSATTATWQTMGSAITYSVISATATTSTASGTYIQMNSMTTTPASGTYLVMFSTSGSGSATNNTYQYAIFGGGTVVTNSERDIGTGGGGHTNGFVHTIRTQGEVTVNGSQAIEIRYLAGSGTFTVYGRSMILIKV